MRLDSRSVSRWVAAAGLLAAPILFTVADRARQAARDTRGLQPSGS
jgi:hypothetical protein